MTKIQPGIYRHYKGNYYEVIEVATHADTLGDVVVYRALYDDFKLWVRPLDAFLESVEVQGHNQNRFEFIGAELDKLVM